MKFFQLIRSSIYGPEFYRSLLKKSFWSSVGYFLALIVIISVLLAGIFSFSAVPVVRTFLHALGPRVVNYYPDGLEITIKDGAASSNVEEPFFLELPEEISSSEDFEEENSDIEHLAVIDTKNEFSVDVFRGHHALGVLNRTTFSFRDDNDTIRVQTLEEIPNVTVTKDRVASFVEKLGPFIDKIPFFIPIVIFFGIFVLYSFIALHLLFGALLVWGIAKLKKIPLSYGKAYQFSLHMATLGVLVDALFFIFGGDMRFLFTILLVFVAWFNLSRMGKEPLIPGDGTTTSPP